MRSISEKIANLRVEYSLKAFDESQLVQNPFSLFKIWIEEAIIAEVNEPNAMTLATVKEDGSPSARIVLLKGVDERGFSFYTNYKSSKGNELAQNNKVALVFCWLELQRQVRIEGTVEKLSNEESLQYFQTRPLSSQIGAFASPQSQLIKSRAQLEDKFKEIEAKFANQTIPLPPNWGGFLVKPHKFEFWQGRKSRLHDRFLFESNNNNWEINRLAP